MTNHDSAPQLSADAARYPDPTMTVLGPLYGRGVWELGEDGGDGIVVQGHDRRAWAAFNRYCRDLGIDRPGSLGLPRTAWVTFRMSCGCTDDEHAEHRAEQDTVHQHYVAARADGASIVEAAQSAPPARTCEEVTANHDCCSLPPCADQFAWMFTRHDPDSEPVPDTAAPILVWD